MIIAEKIDLFTGHKDCVYSLQRANTATHFFSAAGDGQVVEWDVETPDWGKQVAKATNSIYATCFDASKNYLWIGHNYEGIHVIDLKDNQLVASIKLSEAAIFDIKIHNNRAFVAMSNGILSVIDTANLAVVQQIKISEKSVRSLAIQPNSNELWAGCSDFTIKIFDVETFQLKNILEGHTNSIFSIQFTNDFKKLISGGRDASLRIWETENYAFQQEIKAHLFAINHIEFSPNGMYFATCSMDKSIKIWDATSFRLLKVIDRSRHAGHGTSINRLLWLSSEILLAASDDRSISAWKLYIS